MVAYSKMNIAFINNSDSFKNASFKNFSSNPGIGGTEYVTFRIIYELALRNPTWNFFLITNHKIKNETNLNNVYIINDALDLFFNVCILPTGHIDFFLSLNLQYDRLYGWSHHPHDQATFKSLKFTGLISIGKYQYYSNYFRFGKHLIIENPYPSPKVFSWMEKETLIQNNNLTFVYLGGVNPAKGLHKVLKAWGIIVAKIPNATFEVVGGDLYNEGHSISDDCLLVGGKYGRLLQKTFLGLPKTAQRQVIFHGKLDAKKVESTLAGADFALLNPTGKSEASPASPLECACFGVPAIAGGDFGMADVMKYFPDLDVLKSDYSALADRITDRGFQRRQSEKAIKNAIKNYAINDAVYDTWGALIKGDNINFPQVRINKLIYISIRSFIFTYPRRFIKFLISRFL